MAELNDALMQAFRELLSKAIRDVNTDSGLTAEQKAQDIKAMTGIPRQDMFDFLNTNYRTGMDIHDNIKQLVSKDRPHGGPSKKNTKKKT